MKTTSRKPLRIVDVAQLQAARGGFSLLGMIAAAIKKEPEPYMEVKLENTQVTSY